MKERSVIMREAEVRIPTSKSTNSGYEPVLAIEPAVFDSSLFRITYSSSKTPALLYN